MCYIPLDSVSGSLNAVCDVHIMPEHSIPDPAPLRCDSMSSTSSVTKRKATSALEHEQTKKPRASSEASGEISGSGTSLLSAEAVERMKMQMAAQAAKIEKLEEEAAQVESLKHEVAEMQKLNSDLDEAEEGRRDRRIKFFTLEQQYETLQAAQKPRASGSTITKKIEDSIKKGYEQKLETQKKQHDEKFGKLRDKHQGSLDSKDAAYIKKIDDLKSTQIITLMAKEDSKNKKLDEWKAQHKKIIADAKEREQDCKSELAEAKKDFHGLEKKLEAEQQKEIKKWKREHSQAVKDRDQTIKEVSADNLKAKKALENVQVEVTRCGKEIDRLETEKKTLKQIVEQIKLTEADLCTEVNGKERDIIAMLRMHAEEKITLNEVLQYEGRRWQLQYDKAENLALSLVAQQRSNFELKGMTKSRDKRIEALNVENSGLHCELERVKAGKGSASDTVLPTVKDALDATQADKDGTKASSSDQAAAVICDKKSMATHAELKQTFEAADGMDESELIAEQLNTVAA